MITLRTFIAIVLDEELLDHLVRLQDHLREQVAPRSVRWVRPGGIHLTLKFLGDTPQEQVQAPAVQGLLHEQFVVLGELLVFLLFRRERLDNGYPGQPFLHAGFLH